MSESIGKKAERKIREWLDRPDSGNYFYRIPDQVSGFLGSTNPCDFFLYKYPEFYGIESKATEQDRFDFSMISDYQRQELLRCAQVPHAHGIVIVLFATYKRAFVLDIKDIDALWSSGVKSLNITKISKWPIPYKEIATLPSRKELLDYDPSQSIF